MDHNKGKLSLATMGKALKSQVTMRRRAQSDNDSEDASPVEDTENDFAKDLTEGSDSALPEETPSEDSSTEEAPEDSVDSLVAELDSLVEGLEDEDLKNQISSISDRLKTCCGTNESSDVEEASSVDSAAEEDFSAPTGDTGEEFSGLSPEAQDRLSRL